MIEIDIIDIFHNVIDYKCDRKISFNKASIDSRTVRVSDIFFGIKGEHLDGNFFAHEALSKGAGLTVLDNKEAYKQVKDNKILVNSSIDSLKELGSYILSIFDGEKIIITGSVGKTSTKEILSAVLSKGKNIYRSYKNYNNELGVSISCSNIDLTASVAIFEIGTSNKGEIENLARYIGPDTAIITNIGYSHIGNFSNFKELAYEKFSVVKAMRSGTLWINSDFKNLFDRVVEGLNKEINIKTFGINHNADIYISSTGISGIGTTYSVEYKEQSYDFCIRHFYQHYAINSLPCIALALARGIQHADISDALEDFDSLDGRGEIIIQDNLTLIDDTYNAPFESIISAIRNFSRLGDGDKVAIIGSMAEIDGYEKMLYGKIVEEAMNNKTINFIFCGEEYLKFNESSNIKIRKTKEETIELVKDLRAAFILVKAARVNRFEDIIDSIKNNAEIKDAI